MRRLGLTLALLLAFGATPVFAAESASGQPTAAEIDRLLDVMDMKSMMTAMMEQMTQAQQPMLVEAFGKDASEADRARMQSMFAKTDDIMRKHMEWSVLEPVVRNVYARVFTRQEVAAMTAFYSSQEGSAILKKSPQAAALTMQELQPVFVAAMADVKAAIETEVASSKP